MVGANLRRKNRPPNALPAKYAEISATQTRTNTENKKLIPMMRACATATHATHSAAIPPARRKACGTPAQALTPPFSSHAPTMTHVPPATTQTIAKG